MNVPKKPEPSNPRTVKETDSSLLFLSFAIFIITIYVSITW